jgi:hypothetical protein
VMKSLRSCPVFEENINGVHVRCLVCMRYDAAGLGGWMKRASSRDHLKAKTHVAYAEQWANEERQKREDDERRASAYQAPVEWQELPHALHETQFHDRPNMFPEASSISAGGRTLEDLGLSANDFQVELPPSFDFEEHRTKIKEEAELLYARLSEVRLDDADDEDIVEELEDVMDAVNPGGAREPHFLSRSSYFLIDRSSARART